MHQFNWSDILTQWPTLMTGAKITLQITVLAIVVGIIWGTVLALFRLSGVKPLQWFASAYVTLFRSIPLVMVLLWFFLIVPQLLQNVLGLSADIDIRLASAMVAFSLFEAAYYSEIIRAGIQAVPHGQLEAAAALALSRAEAFRHVVLRPALAKVWPALSSQIIIVMLGSAVCSQIATQELSFAANFIQSRNFRAFETYLVTTLLYLLMAILVRWGLAWPGWAGGCS